MQTRSGYRATKWAPEHHAFARNRTASADPSTVSTAFFDVRAPGLADALAAPMAASAWEVLRRLARPSDAEELSRTLNADAGTIRGALEALSEAGVVEKLPIRAHRRQPHYRTNGESLVVAHDPGNESDSNAVARIAAALRERVTAPIGQAGRGGRHALAVAWRTVQLEPDEQAELRRLIREVLDFVEATQVRIRKVDGPAAATANVHIAVELWAAEDGTAPVPAVHFVPHGEAAKFTRTSASAAMRPLSPREREIAMLLVNGHSKPEIARRLRVSGNTVATITKRIYAKLGVRRRVELSNRIRRGMA